MNNNDIQITHWERKIKNKTQELAYAIKEGTLDDVKEKAQEVMDAAYYLRLRAVALHFRRNVLPLVED